MPTRYGRNPGPIPQPKICKKPPPPLPPQTPWPIAVNVTVSWTWHPAPTPPATDVTTAFALHDTGLPQTWEGQSRPDYPKIVAEVTWEPQTKMMRLEVQYWTDAQTGTIAVIENIPYTPVPAFTTPLLATADHAGHYSLNAVIFTA
jgi:hypothetical protein